MAIQEMKIAEANEFCRSLNKSATPAFPKIPHFSNPAFPKIPYFSNRRIRILPNHDFEKCGIGKSGILRNARLCLKFLNWNNLSVFIVKIEWRFSRNFLKPLSSKIYVQTIVFGQISTGLGMLISKPWLRPMTQTLSCLLEYQWYYIILVFDR